MIQITKKALIAGRIYSIADLNDAQIAFSAIDIKGKVPILVIDDQGFEHTERLRDEGYNLKCIKRIDDLRAASEYPIVICDIKGVGTQYDSEKGGLEVVRKLKKMYPFKQYAVYSGNDYLLEELDGLEGVSRIPKSTDFNTWMSYFDVLIENAASPIENWKTIRTFMLNKDVSLLEVLKMENSYVYTYLNNRSNIRFFPDKKEFPNLNDDIRAVINGVIAAVISKLIIGI